MSGQSARYQRGIPARVSTLERWQRVCFVGLGKPKLLALIYDRCFWETGDRVKAEGQCLVVTATFPIPSVKQ